MIDESEGDNFKKDVLKLAGDEVKTCIQCGTCSASCPVAHLMDNSTRKLIKFVLEGMKEEALNSKSIWLCTSCLLCTVRCPRGIKPVSVIAALKQIYEKEGMKCKDSIFEEIFNRQIRDHGRVSEFLLSSEYMLRSPQSAARIISFGTELIPKGKIEIDFRGEQIKGTNEMKRIFEDLGEIP
ncbi:MAG: 4Fe-4S dicluster domain-containing protein [Methanotrichaceae archaeon]